VESLISLLPLLLMMLISCLFAWYFSRGAKNAPAGPGGVRPYGTKGWLGFYIFVSTFIAPLYIIAMLNSALMDVESKTPAIMSLDGWTAYKTASWLRAFMLIAWQWWVAYGLKSRLVPRSVFHVKLFCLAAPVAGTLADVAAGALLLGVVAGMESLGGFLKAAVSGGVWFLYFVRSKRVKNTYYPAAQPGDVAQAVTPIGAFAAIPPTVETNGAPVVASAATSAHNIAPPTSLETRLETLKELLSKGLISSEDYERKKAELLQQL
jgi:hypothetical protein